MLNSFVLAHSWECYLDFEPAKGTEINGIGRVTFNRETRTAYSLPFNPAYKVENDEPLLLDTATDLAWEQAEKIVGHKVDATTGNLISTSGGEEGRVPQLATNDSAVAVLIDFVRTIEATGGLISFNDGTYGCACDTEWLDLADCALKAQAALKERGVHATFTITPDAESDGDEANEAES
jgi:hypothetical protein